MLALRNDEQTPWGWFRYSLGQMLSIIQYRPSPLVLVSIQAGTFHKMLTVILTLLLL